MPYCRRVHIVAGKTAGASGWITSTCSKLQASIAIVGSSWPGLGPSIFQLQFVSVRSPCQKVYRVASQGCNLSAYIRVHIGRGTIDPSHPIDEGFKTPYTVTYVPWFAPTPQEDLTKNMCGIHHTRPGLN